MKEKKVKRFLAITMFVLLAFIFCSGTFVVKSSVAAATFEMNNMSMQKNAIITNSADQAFKGATGIGKYGFYILNLEMPANYYDVNQYSYLSL